MVPPEIGASLACLIFGLNLGFVIGACWHAHWTVLGEGEGEGEPAQPEEGRPE